MPITELRPSIFDEDLAVRQRAGHQGWSIDEDGWFRRLKSPTDPKIGDLGFETKTEVYVASAKDALRFDRGITTLKG